MQRQIKCKANERTVLKWKSLFWMRVGLRATNLAVLCLRSDKSPWLSYNFLDSYA